LANNYQHTGITLLLNHTYIDSHLCRYTCQRKCHRCNACAHQCNLFLLHHTVPQIDIKMLQAKEVCQNWK